MISSWDDELILVHTRTKTTDHITVHENIVLAMERSEEAIPHRLDLVSKLLNRMAKDGYLLNEIAWLDAEIIPKELTI